MVNVTTILKIGGLALAGIATLMSDRAKEIEQEKVIEEKVHNEFLAQQSKDEEA